MNPIQTETYRGCRIEIVYDQYCDSPREWDNLGTIACWHRRYKLGDVQPDVEPGLYVDTVVGTENGVYLTVYAYIHSGIALSTKPFDCPWDSGRLGYIWCSLEKARKEWSLRPDADWSTKLMASGELPEESLGARVARVLRGEIETYSQYLGGECYGYRVLSPDGEEIDSCYGYIGRDEFKYMTQCAKDTVDRWVEEPSNHNQDGEH